MLGPYGKQDYVRALLALNVMPYGLAHTRLLIQLVCDPFGGTFCDPFGGTAAKDLS